MLSKSLDLSPLGMLKPKEIESLVLEHLRTNITKKDLNRISKNFQFLNVSLENLCKVCYQSCHSQSIVYRADESILKASNVSHFSDKWF